MDVRSISVGILQADAREGAEKATCTSSFSGTGSSLPAEEQIGEGLGNREIVSFASPGGHEGPILPEAERADTACPVCGTGRPALNRRNGIPGERWHDPAHAMNRYWNDPRCRFFCSLRQAGHLR